MSPFKFVYLGPATKINFSIVNCSTIDITWTAPTVDDGVSILYYILRIYDAITGSLVDTIAIGSTSRAPVNVRFTIECNETGVEYDNTILVENATTGSVPVPLNDNCSFITVVSNCTGSSEPFKESFNTTPPSAPTISNAPSPTDLPTLDDTIVIIGSTLGAIVVLTIVPIPILIAYCLCKHRSTTHVVQRNGKNQGQDQGDTKL
uniref:Fibronectin type-III domain-containing protein n=1 Tax=Amphimedon queenslandica TaxID=400682 RepID=A0A1X7T2K3_AMPQE